MRAHMALALSGTVFLGHGCSGPAQQAPPASAPAGAAAADPNAEAMLRSFAAAIVARDYAAAHGAIASQVRGSRSLQELQEAISHYRDGLPDALATKVSVEPFDRESADLVPDELKDRITAEGAVHFEPGGEAEGFSVLVWVLMEAGEPKIAHYFVGD